MSARFIEALKKKPLLPLLTAEAPSAALGAARALNAGGIPAVEVGQRTDSSLESLRVIASEAPELIVGAGTVLSAADAIACIEAGAEFIVSPGLDEAVIGAAGSRGVLAIPGIMTPTELQHAHRLELGIVKFFPAASAGGVDSLKSLAAAFQRTRFIPTGGISVADLSDYLAIDAVLACGGSWMTPADAMASGDFARLTELATNALAIATQARGI
ncbi:MAG: bifunctional 4-hydroxy-2-oxoglutarate aldolase/2-dehydro-3-deoxy-phosphogluconate aldolase [Gammaproteobacteria bacterium]